MKNNFERKETKEPGLEYYELTEQEKNEMTLDLLIWFLLRKYKTLCFARYPEGKNRKQQEKVDISEKEKWSDEYEGEQLSRNALSFLNERDIEWAMMKRQREQKIESKDWKFVDAVEAITKIIYKNENENIGLASWILKEKTEEEADDFDHIPMIDFKCKISEENKAKIQQFLEGLGEREGFLLISGKSYHYYGTNRLTTEEWEKFNQKISDSELVGKVWPKLQLKNKISVLRLTTSPAKPAPPQIYGIFGKELKKSLF